MPTSGNRRRLTVLLGALVLASVLVWWIRRPSPTPQPASPEAASKVTSTNLAVLDRPVRLPAVPLEPNPDDPNVPLIDEVSVEKTEVCRGEQNFLKVKAHTRNHTDTFLGTRFLDPSSRSYVLGGDRIPFRLNRPLEGALTVIVEGNISSKTVVVPPVHVNDCEVPRQLVVQVRRMRTALDRVSMTAELRQSSASTPSPMVPVKYEWDFGDGATETTSTNQVKHSYEAREQDVRLSSFVVTVTASDATGKSEKGSSVVAFPNGAFAPLKFKNRVVISIGVEEADPSRGQHEKIWLYHGYGQEVRIERVELSEKVEEADGFRETMRRSYDPSNFLGLGVVPPKKTSELRDLTEHQPSSSTAIRTVEMSGHSADGKEASGAFTLLPPKKAKEEQELHAQAP